MIPALLRVTLGLGILLYFMLILIFLKNKALELKYTLLWMAAGVLMLLLVIFPQLLFMITRLLGIESGMNGLFIICIAFLIVLVMSLTSIVSRQMRKINILVQQQAIIDNELRELKQYIKGKQSDDETGKSVSDTDNI